MDDEQRLNAMVGVQMILASIEGDPLRPELRETPKRVVNALIEMLDGYNAEIDSLFTTFDGEGTDQLIIIKNIPFVSLCAHHLLPFSGKTSVGYLPNGRALGASKIPRLLSAFSHRLQMQERIAEQIAKVIMDKLKPDGVAVVIEGVHLCMTCRGIKSSGSSMVNSVMLGRFREDATLRAEFLSLIKL